MKTTNLFAGLAAMLCITAEAQIIQPILPPGKLAVFKAGTPDTNWPMVTARVAPCFVQVFDPVTNNQPAAMVNVPMSTNASVPGSVWINHHAGSEGGGISLSVNREFICLEGYTGNILSPTSAKPSTDPSVSRGIVTLDAFTNAIDVYSSQNTWFGIPVGVNPANNQDNPTGIASTDGTNFWGTGNFAGTSSELDGTLFYNSVTGGPFEVQNYLQAAGEAHIVNGSLYIATKPAGGVASGIYDFVDAYGNAVPLPWDPDVSNPYFNFATTNLYLNWGNKYQAILNFDMDPGQTVAYGADQTYGIVKFINQSGTWVPAPYYFSATNLDTLAQTVGNQGCFGICVDFSGANPVIYATTMENGGSTNYPGGFGVNASAGHQNNNRIIKIVDTGVAPGTSVVAQTLAVATTTNEFFGGITFTPDLRPRIVSQPANYATTTSGSGSLFTVIAQSSYAMNYQWFENGTAMNPAVSPTCTNAALDLTALASIANYNSNGFTNQYQCVITNNYGAATSIVATLTVTVNPTPPVITSGTNLVAGFVSGSVTFAPVTASGTQPFTFQWYFKGTQLVDDGVKYAGSTTASLTISNLLASDAGSYYMVVMNPSPYYASNIVDILSVNYHLATITAGQPASVTTFTNLPATLTATSAGGTPPVTNQWYQGATMLTDGTEFSGSQTPTLTIAANTTNDTANNYYLVVSNPGGSVTSILASVIVEIPPVPSSVAYSNQFYYQSFDVLPDPETSGIAKNGTATGNGGSVNSFNNPKDPGGLGGNAYSLANPFDFAYPVIGNSYLGGLALGTGTPNLFGWYGAADTNTAADGVDGITRFGAQDGDQSTGGVIDFGPNDVEGGLVGTNRALGLLSTGTTGSTSFGVKMINTSGTTLNYINVSFLGELWRNNTGARTISFSYAVDPTADTFTLAVQPKATNTVPLDLPNAITVPNLAFSFPTNPAGTLAVDGTQPANQVRVATNNMALATPWSPGAALWLVWSINYYGAGSGQGYAIDNLALTATPNATVSTAPTVLDLGPSNVSITNATLNLAVNPQNSAGVYWIYYGTTANPFGALGSSAGASGNFAPGSSPIGITSGLQNLLPGTVYHYQMVAQNAFGTTVTTDATFTTPPAPVVVVTTAPSLIGTVNATFNGTINPEGGATAYWFVYGTTTSYGSYSATNVLPAGTSSVSVSNLVTGLQAGTVYHYQLMTASVPGTAAGGDISFTTVSGLPLAATLPATNIFATAAKLVGSINVSNGVTSCWFIYGTNSTYAYTNLTAPVSVAATNGTAIVTNTAVIAGLSPSTLYYYQIVATNFAGTSVGGSISNFTTAALAGGPIVSNTAASSILATTAKLNATVNPNSDAASYWFAYWVHGTTATNFTAPGALAAATNASAVNSSPAGLAQGTLYNYQIMATNAYGIATLVGGVSNFTTATISVPAVTTLAASNLLASTATLDGSVNPSNGVTIYWYMYGTNNSFAMTNLTKVTTLSASNSAVAIVTNQISGLSQATPYFFQLAASNSAGATVLGGIQSFTTPNAALPTVATLPASKINSSGATVAGSVVTNLDVTTYWFVYGTNNSTAMTNLIAPKVLGSVTTAGGIVTNSSALTGLLPATTYYYEIVATNLAGMSFGSVSNFATTNLAPTLTPIEAQNVTGGGATLGAIVSPNNAATGYWFKYGTNAALGNGGTVTNTLAAGYSAVVASKAVTGLAPNTVYYFQVLATNAGGVTMSWNTTFSTLPIQVPQLNQVKLSGGKLAFTFTNTAGVTFSVRATNNISAPRANWPVIGTVSDSASPGVYQFNDPNPSTNSSLFYFISQP